MTPFCGDKQLLLLSGAHLSNAGAADSLFSTSSHVLPFRTYSVVGCLDIVSTNVSSHSGNVVIFPQRNRYGVRLKKSIRCSTEEVRQDVKCKELRAAQVTGFRTDEELTFLPHARKMAE